MFQEINGLGSLRIGFMEEKFFIDLMKENGEYRLFRFENMPRFHYNEVIEAIDYNDKCLIEFDYMENLIITLNEHVISFPKHIIEELFEVENGNMDFKG